MTAEELASRIEHTDLAPGSAEADIARLCDEARAHEFAAVCVSPIRVAQAVAQLGGSSIVTCAVVGFPSGTHETAIKVREAASCVENGAAAIDMVANTGWLRDGDYSAYTADISAVRSVIGHKAILKVIIEAPLLDSTLIAEAARLAVQSGAGYIKTSTGVYAQARLEDVRLLRSVLEPRIMIKAAGGIRSAAFALELIDAGADRLGTSKSVEIMREMA